MRGVTYGVISASFHSIRSLLELAKPALEKVRQIIEHDKYVDDLLTGCSNIGEAKKLTKLIDKNFADKWLPFTKVDVQQSRIDQTITRNSEKPKMNYRFKRRIIKLKL